MERKGMEAYLRLGMVAMGLALLLGGCDPKEAPKKVPAANAMAVAADVRLFVDQWLQIDCDFSGDGGRADSALVWREQVIPLLLDAAVNGPSDSLSAQYLQGVHDMYSRIERRYATGDSILFSDADRDAYAKQTWESFSERRYKAWATAYQSHALIALAELKYEKGRDLFEDVLADTALVDLHAAAKQGLEYY